MLWKAAIRRTVSSQAEDGFCDPWRPNSSKKAARAGRTHRPNQRHFPWKWSTFETHRKNDILPELPKFAEVAAYSLLWAQHLQAMLRGAQRPQKQGFSSVLRGLQTWDQEQKSPWIENYQKDIGKLRWEQGQHR
jgi:hypothetical protein